MLMSEEQAREKICPFARSFDASAKADHGLVGVVEAKCIASRCMAWEIGDNHIGNVLEAIRMEPGSTRPVGPDWYSGRIGTEYERHWVRREVTKRGYCGRIREA